MSETATVVPIAAAKESRIRKLSLLAYGASGVGKTTQFRYFSKYVWDKYQLKSRFICLDGGSLWECVQDYGRGIRYPPANPCHLRIQPLRGDAEDRPRRVAGEQSYKHADRG